MPGAAVGIGLGIGGLGQRLMDLLAVGHGGRPVCRRTQQRMTEPHPGTELDETRGQGGAGRVDPESESPGRAPQQGDVAERFGRRRQQEASRLGGQWLELPDEALLDPVRQRLEVRRAESARQLRRRQPTRQLQQSKRVAARLGDDPVADAFIQAPGDGGMQQRRCVTLIQPAHDELGKSREILCRAGLAHREDQADRLRQQAARDERQDLGRGPILPVRVIHHADERAVLRHLRQQAQHRQSNEKAVWRVAGTEPERRGQRIALRGGKAIETIEHRPAELMQTRERELHLGLHSCRTYDATPRGTLDERREQCGLADPGLAADDQHRALPGAHGRHQAIERLALAATAEQPRGLDGGHV